jgi:NTP pyrophosphatase (non-canonical NTP hydrolase)
MITSAESKLVDVAALQAALRQFAAERDWGQFHSPKNLAMALTGEVGELVEIFQWMPETESRTAMTSPKTAEALNAEIADVFIYLSRLADVLGVDLDAAVKAKLASNAARYPAETVRGSSEKR